jgi:hypothetical protein
VAAEGVYADLGHVVSGMLLLVRARGVLVVSSTYPSSA